MNLAISKEIVRLEDSELKIARTFTLENMAFIDKNKEVLAAMKHKVFQGIEVAVERAKVSLRSKRDIQGNLLSLGNEQWGLSA